MHICDRSTVGYTPDVTSRGLYLYQCTIFNRYSFSKLSKSTNLIVSAFLDIGFFAMHVVSKINFDLNHFQIFSN